ncbi:hypothetical protein [Coxiella-like endosymbiont of Rhipicephalus sanguineus]|uniref:hypothetical protein n=1 Tax=Coxiella-like endosymbiont of Rhipicephalus sanguineus TaxID=1955402 RepID=UPI002040AC53|nr:hypothetical protein [Coxiella-like endosymbiont of Rhipicephalus sanguineus]
MKLIQNSLLGYRQKARLSVKYVIKKDKVLIEFREINARYGADIQRCEIVDPSNQSTY